MKYSRRVAYSKRKDPDGKFRQRGLRGRRKVLRQELVQQLGGQCQICGKTTRLEIDHIYGREWNVSAPGYAARIKRYIEEAKKGLLRVLCRRCNATYNPTKKDALRPH